MPNDDFRGNYRFGTFVIWPPDAVRQTVNALRYRYDPGSAHICEAHITLTQPLVCEPDSEFWMQVETVVCRFPPLEIEYGPLDSFLPYPCAYLRIRPAEPLLELRSALHALGHFNLALQHTDDFIPHMSITDGYPDATQTGHILDALEHSAPRGSFQCTQIAYIVPDAEFRFSPQRTIKLSS